MPWENDKFRYSLKLISLIAENYAILYEGIPRNNYEIMDALEIAELKADFDMALSSLGKLWRGVENAKFRYYRRFTELQRAVILIILGIPDNEDTSLYNPSELRHTAYILMTKFLNEGKYESRPKRDSY